MTMKGKRRPSAARGASRATSVRSRLPLALKPSFAITRIMRATPLGWCVCRPERDRPFSL